MSVPMETFVTNVTGSFIICFFLTLVGDRVSVNPNWRRMIAVGFVGAFTTFSTFEYETLEPIDDGRVLNAALNVS